MADGTSSIYAPLGASQSLMQAAKPTSGLFSPAGASASQNAGLPAGTPGVKGSMAPKLQSMLGGTSGGNLSLLNYAGPDYFDLMDQYSSGMWPTAGFF